MGLVLRALMGLISGLRARVVAGQAKSFEYAMLDTLPEGKVLSPLEYILGADGLPRLLLEACAHAYVDIGGERVQWPMLAFVDDNTIVAFRMRGLQLAAKVLDRLAETNGLRFSRAKTFAMQLRLGVMEGEEEHGRNASAGAGANASTSASTSAGTATDVATGMGVGAGEG